MSEAIGTNGITRKLYNLLKRKARRTQDGHHTWLRPSMPGANFEQYVMLKEDLPGDATLIAKLVGVTEPCVWLWKKRCDTSNPVCSGSGIAKALSAVQGEQDLDDAIKENDTTWIRIMRSGSFFEWESTTESELLDLQSKLSASLAAKAKVREEAQKRIEARETLAKAVAGARSAGIPTSEINSLVSA